MNSFKSNLMYKIFNCQNLHYFNFRTKQVKYQNVKTDEVISHFYASCSTYSSLVMTKSYKNFLKSKFTINETATPTTYSVTSDNINNYDVNIEESTCTCPMHTSHKLPCKHIFATRKYLKLQIFDPKMVSKRWLKQTYASNAISQITNRTVTTRNFNFQKNINISPVSVSTKSSNYNEIFRFNQELTQSIISGSKEEANDKFEILKLVKEMWEKGLKVYVAPLNDFDDTNSE